MRGEIVLGGEYLEATEASERYSKDLLQKARAVLRVEADADEGALKKAYRMRALEVHPDKVAEHNKSVKTRN